MELFRVIKSRASEHGGIIDVDLCGPMKELSLNTSGYILLLKEHFSNYRFVYFNKHKSDVYGKLKELLVYFENQNS